jgi:hypothetical protein
MITNPCFSNVSEILSPIKTNNSEASPSCPDGGGETDEASRCWMLDAGWSEAEIPHERGCWLK